MTKIMTEDEMVVINNTIELMKTMEEGIDYVNKKFNELKVEETINMLIDLTEAFTTIEGAVSPLIVKFEENEIESKNEELKSALEILLKDLEQTNGKKAIDIMKLHLIPKFDAWKEEMTRVLKPYIVS
ncbi:Zn-dependent oligopeptidase [Desulfitispora alkaliphila]